MPEPTRNNGAPWKCSSHPFDLFPVYSKRTSGFNRRDELRAASRIPTVYGRRFPEYHPDPNHGRKADQVLLFGLRKRFASDEPPLFPKC